MVEVSKEPSWVQFGSCGRGLIAEEGTQQIQGLWTEQLHPTEDGSQPISSSPAFFLQALDTSLQTNRKQSPPLTQAEASWVLQLEDC